MADRIIILKEGQLRCSGSSLFLKTRFGAGYMLTVSVTSTLIHDDNVNYDQNEEINAKNDHHLAIDLVLSAIPQATIRSHIAVSEVN